MSYWIVVTTGEGHRAKPPIGTRKVLRRELLEDGTIRWLVEGADYMEILPTVLEGVLSVERASESQL